MGDLGTDEGRRLEDRLGEAERRLGCFSDSRAVTDECLDLLARARAELVAERFAECKDLALRAECVLERAKKSLATVKGWWVPITGYVVVFFYVVLVVASRGHLLVGRQVIDMHWPGWLPPAPYFVLGALGGAAACLFGLFLHASLRDFDKAYIPWYFIKPVMGLVFGPLIYYLARAGLMATTDGVTIEQPSLLYLGAFVIAFGERLSIRLVDRVSTAIFGPPGPPGAVPPSPTRPGPVTPATGGAPSGGGPAGGEPSGGSIRATVKGPEDVEDVSATLMRGGETIEVKGPPPDQDSTFVFEGLAPGAYQLLASKEGWRQVGEASAEIERAGQVAEVEATLEAVEPKEEEGGKT